VQRHNIGKEVGKDEGIISTLLNLGHTMSRQGMYTEALMKYEEARSFAASRCDGGGDCVATAKARTFMGLIYAQLSEYGKAMEHLTESAKIQIEALANGNVEYDTILDLATSFTGMANVHYYQKKPEMALKMHNEVLKIKLKMFGPENVEVATTYNNMGVVYKSMDQYEEAMEYLKKSLGIRLKLLGGEHVDVAVTYYNMGNVYRMLNEYNKAMALFKMSLRIHLQCFDECNVEVREKTDISLSLSLSLSF
jgi:tetratricopeptide (TPR) repeat protein